MKFIPLILACSSYLLGTAGAATVAHWRFDDLSDSSGNGHAITNANPTTSLSGGSMVFTGGGSGGQIVSTPNIAAWSDTSFTIEAIITPTAIPTTGPTTIVAHLANPGGGRQWLFGYNNGNLSLLLGQTNEGAAASEVYYTSTAITPHVNGNTYYVAVAIDLTAIDPAGRITFYSQDLTNGGALQSGNSSSPFSGNGLTASTAALTFGSTGHSSSRFTGSIAEVRFSDEQLTAAGLLIPEPSISLLALAGTAALATRRSRRG